MRGMPARPGRTRRVRRTGRRTSRRTRTCAARTRAGNRRTRVRRERLPEAHGSRVVARGRMRAYGHTARADRTAARVPAAHSPPPARPHPPAGVGHRVRGHTLTAAGHPAGVPGRTRECGHAATARRTEAPVPAAHSHPAWPHPPAGVGHRLRGHMTATGHPAVGPGRTRAWGRTGALPIRAAAHPPVLGARGRLAMRGGRPGTGGRVEGWIRPGTGARVRVRIRPGTSRRVPRATTYTARPPSYGRWSHHRGRRVPGVGTGRRPGRTSDGSPRHRLLPHHRLRPLRRRGGPRGGADSPGVAVIRPGWRGRPRRLRPASAAGALPCRRSRRRHAHAAVAGT